MDKLIIHCSATPNGRDNSAEDIHRWHKQKGWDGIGYHYVIRIDGTIESGRPEYWAGAHAKGHNSGSIGICMIGTDKYTSAQWLSLRDLIDQLSILYPNIGIIGHNEVSGKDCPGFDVQKWVAMDRFQIANDGLYGLPS